ncbi:ATP-dependent helicase C-terminal domain-containing protein, partial [Sphingomonas sp. AR_OL41]|uniref:ATP-dependent helicase C-terminal domain-containing protein n=1 Tax=Sphingomonas sp. AR_OL41 TaxID=3042729 RepID=UPI002480C39D
RWHGERGPRATAARRLAERWASLSPSPLRGEGRGEGWPQTTPPVATPLPSPLPLGEREKEAAIAIALAFPDRIAKRRDGSGETWASVGGRGFKLDPTSPLARAEWLAVAETQGMAAGARILSAVAIDAATVEALFADRIETKRSVSFDPATGGVSALRERRLGAVRLSSGPDSAADPAAIAEALLAGVRQHGLDLLPWPESSRALRARATFAAEHGGAAVALDDAALLAEADAWLAPLLAGKRRLDQIDPGGLADALRNIIGWDGMKAIERLAPSHFDSPAGSSHPIDYEAEAGPRVELRPQALFGLAAHPMVGGGRVPLVLSLTSPAGRPIQTTRDLPGFWAGSWADVAREMRGRYPRHPWPDDPAAANPTLRTKNADARRGGSR